MKNARGRLPLLILGSLVLTTFPACSVFLAANQPDKKNLSVLVAGTPRARILAEFGQPVSSRLVDNRRIDLFSITQGYSKEAKAGRAFAHGVGDIATVGMWELAGTPTEVVFSGKKLSYEVTYDYFDRVARVVKLSE